jgi:hypothetical protein
MNCTIATTAHAVDLRISGQVSRLTASAARALSRALDRAAYEAEAKAGLTMPLNTVCNLNAAAQPLDTCPRWAYPMPENAIRRAGPWLTDGLVAVCAALLTPAARAQLSDREIAPIGDTIANTLFIKVLNSTRPGTLVGWLTARRADAQDRPPRAIVAVLHAGQPGQMFFDAPAFGWCWDAVGAERITLSRVSHLATLWRGEMAVGILQGLPKGAEWLSVVP